MVEGRNHHYSTRRIEMVRMVVVSSFYHHSTRRIETVRDRKSTRLNSSHDQISYAVFCLKKKKKHDYRGRDASALTHVGHDPDAWRSAGRGKVPDAEAHDRLRGHVRWLRGRTA